MCGEGLSHTIGCALIRWHLDVWQRPSSVQGILPPEEVGGGDRKDEKTERVSVGESARGGPPRANVAGWGTLAGIGPGEEGPAVRARGIIYTSYGVGNGGGCSGSCPLAEPCVLPVPT